MHDDPAYGYMNREISWLAFNARVLQEAQDPSVPLFERLFFLGVFSANLDEFFRVRVASLRSLLRLKHKAAQKTLDFNPLRLLGRIQRIVTAQQETFGQTFSHLLRELQGHGVFLATESEVSGAQAAWLRTYFDRAVRPHLTPVVLGGDGEAPFLKDRGLYLVVELWPKEGQIIDEIPGPHYALIEVPGAPLPRFVTLPRGEEPHRTAMFLDDVIRLNLPRLFDAHEVGAAYAVKLSRDAELYLDEENLKDEFAGNLARLIKMSLSKRETGLPCRFLYDQRAPFALVERLKEHFGLASEDLVLGGRYHNLHELMDFPRFRLEGLSYAPLPPLPHPALERAPSLLAAVAERDHLLHFPYQRFGYVTRFLEEAAADPDVEALWITLYRVAEGSVIVEALVRAAEQGKQVTAFVEAKARFDEARNLESAERMEAAGVRVLYSLPKLKVHAKIALAARREGEAERLYAYLGTGNFNEKTALVYADMGLFTADRRLTEEVRRLFAMLAGQVEEPAFEHLLVAPHAMRKGFYRLIDDEIERARAGEEAWMILKMNSLEDEQIIRRLYEASRAGVKIRLVVRGLCCLVAGVAGQSEHIEATSILDRFLEHARVYVFSNGGEEKIYLASADWMKRNLSSRVEVAFPVYDERLRREIRGLLELQLRDNQKARLLDREQQNVYVAQGEGPAVRAQLEAYRLLASRLTGAAGANGEVTALGATQQVPEAASRGA